jgi:hypothetical protein
MNASIIEDIGSEPVTLDMAKESMNIDYPDWDVLITRLIVASREKSEKMSGQSYGIRVYEVTGNQKHEKVYPIGPFIEDVEFEGEDGVKKYRYRAGFHICPESLKLAILQRVATGFAYRQNGVMDAVSMAVNQSHHYEMAYRRDMYV